LGRQCFRNGTPRNRSRLITSVPSTTCPFSGGNAFGRGGPFAAGLLRFQCRVERLTRERGVADRILEDAVAASACPTRRELPVLSIRGLRVRIPSASLNGSSRKRRTCGYCRFPIMRTPHSIWGQSTRDVAVTFASVTTSDMHQGLMFDLEPTGSECGTCEGFMMVNASLAAAPPPDRPFDQPEPQSGNWYDSFLGNIVLPAFETGKLERFWFSHYGAFGKGHHAKVRFSTEHFNDVQNVLDPLIAKFKLNLQQEHGHTYPHPFDIVGDLVPQNERLITGTISGTQVGLKEGSSSTTSSTRRPNYASLFKPP
jgi:hypothetical protein